MVDMDVLEAREYSIFCGEVLKNLELAKKPFIAAINGYALGGGLELALSCDIRIASENAMFGLPEVTLGIIPGWGGIQKLVRIVGLGKAKEIIYSGALIDAGEAMEIGLINKVAEKNKLISEVMGLAKKIAKN
ncbi:unnamed protein product, partial [marine sediment metagenome]